MGYGLTNHLLAICGGVFGVGLFVTWRRLPGSWALTLAAVRVLIPLVYFAWYFDGQWTFLDDMVYVEHGQVLLEQGFTPLSFFNADSRAAVHSLAGSRHVLYSWWNLVVMWLCGTYYYVPVLANVLVTFLSAHLLGELAEELRFPRGYQRLLQVGFLLHWDTVAWSSVANLKDLLVQLMTIAFFLCAIRAVRRRSFGSAAICGLLILGFMNLRFYLPFVIGAAAVAWVFLEWRDVRKYPLLAGGLVVGIWLLPGYAHQLFESFSVFETFYSIGRFTLTPQPWALDESLTFLTVPSMLHWLMILPATCGGVMLWRESRVARLMLIYALILIVLYALAEEIQGVRQRLQLSFVFAWAQLHFLWAWTRTSRQTVRMTVPARAVSRRPAPLPARAA